VQAETLVLELFATRAPPFLYPHGHE